MCKHVLHISCEGKKEKTCSAYRKVKKNMEIIIIGQYITVSAYAHKMIIGEGRITFWELKFILCVFVQIYANTQQILARNTDVQISVPCASILFSLHTYNEYCYSKQHMHYWFQHG